MRQTKEAITTHDRPDIHDHLDWIINKLGEIGKDTSSIKRAVRLNSTRMSQIMATIDEMNALVTEQDTKTDSLIVYLDTIKQMLADALSGASLPPAVQAKVDDMFNRLKANVDQTSAAIDAGTEEPPVEEPPVEEPPVEESRSRF